MKNNRNFDEVLRDIRRSERDVDRLLDAARLERMESGRMTGQQKMQCFLWTLAAITGMALIFCMFCVPVLFR